jgi:TPR repeat protein
MTLRSLCLAGLIVAAAPAAFAADCDATQPPTGELIGRGLLDPATAPAERNRLADLLLCSALAGNANSQDVAGSLYRWGPRHPGHVFPEDHQRARDLLTAAATQGRISAMLKLVELELTDGHAHEAMVWAQVEGIFYRRLAPDATTGDRPSGAGYYTMLLKRASDALGPVDPAKLQNEVDARVTALDRQIAAQPPHDHKGPPLGRTILPAQAKVMTHSPQDASQGAYAQYFVEVGPDGHVTRSWMIDAYPEPASGLRIGRLVPQVHWSALPAGDTEMRYLLLPMSVGSLTRGVHLQ